MPSSFRTVGAISYKALGRNEPLRVFPIFYDKHSHLGVVAVIGTGIVFVGINAVVSDASDGTPKEITEVDDEIRRDVSTFSINLLGFEDTCADVMSLLIYNRFELPFQFIADALIILWVDNPVRFSTFNVYKNSRVIPAFPPCLCLVPIYHIRCPPHNFTWLSF